MRRRLVAVGLAAAVLVVGGVAWAVTARPEKLDADQSAVVDAVEAGQPDEDAADFVGANLEILLSSEVADAVDGGELEALFTKALLRSGVDVDLLDQVVAAVAKDRDIHRDGLHTVLADAVAGEMAWVDQRINAPAAYSAADLPDVVADHYLDLHDFLRETMGDREAAERLHRALVDYGLAETSAAPESGAPRAVRLEQLGRMLTFFSEAQSNAEMGRAVEDEDAAAVEAAESAHRARQAEDNTTRWVWLATDLYASDAAVRAAASGQPFVDDDGNLETDMTSGQGEAFREWARTLVAAGGPAASDDRALDGGSGDVLAPDYGLTIEDRY